MRSPFEALWLPGPAEEPGVGWNICGARQKIPQAMASRPTIIVILKLCNFFMAFIW
jgi:hypothetical protein